MMGRINTPPKWLGKTLMETDP